MASLEWFANVSILFCGVFGFIFSMYALWRIMKATRTIERLVRRIEQR